MKTSALGAGRLSLAVRPAIALRSALALAVAALAPALAYLGNLGFAPVVAAAGLLCLPLLARPRRPSRGVWLLLALLAWALVSYAWSPALPRAIDFHRYSSVEGLTGLKLALELALYGAFVIAMREISPEGGRRAALVLTIGTAVLAGLIVLSAAAGSGVYQSIRAAAGQPIRADLADNRVGRGCFVIAVLFWPLMLTAWRNRLKALPFVVAAGILIGGIALKADAPIAALVVSSLIFALVWKLGRRGLWLCTAGVVAYFAFAPLVVRLVAPGAIRAGAAQVSESTWSIRLRIWDYAERLIEAKPLTGGGLDASRAWPEHIPLHTHDAALQLWLELGPIGAGLAALFFAWLFTRIAMLEGKDRGMAAAAAAACSAYLVIGAVSFGVWQEWWLAVGALTIAVCIWAAAGRHSRPAERPGALPSLSEGAALPVDVADFKPAPKLETP